jgi:hypothetical protein
VGCIEVTSLGQFADMVCLQRRLAPVKACQIPVDREASSFELIAQRAGMAISLFRIQQTQHYGFDGKRFVAGCFCLQFAPGCCHPEEMQGLQA